MMHAGGHQHCGEMVSLVTTLHTAPQPYLQGAPGVAGTREAQMRWTGTARWKGPSGTPRVASTIRVYPYNATGASEGG